jgi:hypothetical protein
MMRQTLLIKHAVGGMVYVDTRVDPVPYSVSPSGEGWQFDVELPPGEPASHLLRHKTELNVFIFQEYEQAPTLKTWYYVKDGPVDYVAELGLLRIYAGSRIEYIPDDYSTCDKCADWSK